MGKKKTYRKKNEPNGIKKPKGKKTDWKTNSKNY